MSFLVILVCLILQWSLNLTSAPYQRNWAEHYVTWMRNKFAKLAEGHNIFGVIVLALPIVIVSSLLFTIVYHLFGHVGYLLFSLALLWFCSDVTFLKQETADIFSQSYKKIFSVLFWYFVFGPVGLTLYIVVRTLQTYLFEQKYFTVLLGVLDWLPMRLLGLSFALVGNFGAVFKEWFKVLWQGLLDNHMQLNSWGDAALGADKNNAEQVILVRRALIVWLVVMALVTIGIWVG